MELRTLVFITVGGLIAAVGGVLMLIAAFRRNILWGLAILLLPLAHLVFTVRHWAVARQGFIVSLGGAALIALGVATSPGLRMAMTHLHGATELAKFKLPTTGFALQSAPAAPTLDQQIPQERAKIERLEAQFASDGQTLMKEFGALTEQRKRLASSDGAAVEGFNHAVAEYQAHNTARQTAKNELDALRLGLSSMLDQRARQAAASPTASAKKVVIYTTTTCPACKMAKAYFAKKGVPYEEHDVSSSPAAQAEFQKLGGHGVPLILVGTERMEGFSAQRLDQLL